MTLKINLVLPFVGIFHVKSIKIMFLNLDAYFNLCSPIRWYLIRLYKQFKNCVERLLRVNFQKKNWLLTNVIKIEGILELWYYDLVTSFYVKQGINQLSDLMRFYVTVFWEWPFLQTNKNISDLFFNSVIKELST